MLPLFKHAIVGLDLSEASDLIIDCIPYLKKFGTKKVTLVTVVPVPYSGERTEFNTDKERRILKEYKKELEKHDLQVETDIRSGVHFYPATEILTSAREKDADYVVIANRGHSKVQEMLLGSTATEVLQRSEFPVYLINIELEWYDDDKEKRKLVLTQTAKNSFKHVLHATDFSNTASRAFNVVREFDKSGVVGKVSLIHVQGHHAIALSDPASREKLTDQNRVQLEEIRNKLSDNTRENAETIVTFGSPAKEIATAADEIGATMIVLGSQGKGFIEKFFLGGVSNQVTRISKVPVLLIPAERE